MSGPRRRDGLPWPLQGFWILIGLVLTVGGNLLQPFAWLPWLGSQPLAIQSSWQVGAVLFTACMGGKAVGAIAQIGYLGLGLSGFGVFWEGGGWDYVRSPSFGYLLGFVPGAWICGHQVYRRAPTLENLAFGCFCGWAVIHLCGSTYVVLSHLTRWEEVGPLLTRYSLNIAPGQLVMICAVTLLAWLLRKVLMY